jgi:1-acyl-sn-glycerol-3-phosphate acyltransferase
VAVGVFRRPVLIAGSVFSFGMIFFFIWQHGSWLNLVGVLAVEAAFFAAIRLALIPAISKVALLPVSSILGLLILGTLGGWLTGFEFAKDFDPRVKVPPGSIPEALQVALVGYGVSFIAFLFIRLPLETANFLREGLFMPLFRAAYTAFDLRWTRRTFCSLVLLFGLFLCVLQMLRDSNEYDLLLTVACGTLVGMLHPHAFRCLAIVPAAGATMLIVLAWGFNSENWERAGLILGGLIGCCAVALTTSFLTYAPKEQRGRMLAVLFVFFSLAALLSCLPLALFKANPDAGRSFLPWCILSLAGIFAIHGWVAFFRAFVETTSELILIPLYRIRGVGDDLYHIPVDRGILVIANHAAWFDPLWLAKVMPRPITPMMTSRFYDLPVISFFMRRVMGTIRVPEIPVRKEAPEIQLAIAALDEGKCVVLFPEGYLRRKEDQPIRRFGRGIWQILAARPDTPVFACWIEGSWGSYFSYKGGPPTKNKRFDWFRKITIAVRKADTMSPEILASHLHTRKAMLQEVVKARSILGLPEIKLSASMEMDSHEKEMEE